MQHGIMLTNPTDENTWRASAADAWLTDVDAGRFDRDLEQSIATYDTQLAQLDIAGQEGGFRLDSPKHVIWAAFQRHIANVPEVLPNHYDNIMLMNHQGVEFARPTERLANILDPAERKTVFSTLGNLTSRHDQIGGLFPSELQKHAGDAYDQTVANLVFTLDALKRGEETPTSLPLRGGSSIKIGTYSFEQAVQAIGALDGALGRISDAVYSKDTPVTRINQTGSYGMYHLGKNGEVIATIRLMPGTSYDPAIEFANREGTEPMIGYSVDMARVHTSAYKKEQVSPFSIRIDNEGEHLSLDIGSILGRPGTFGKTIADLISIGDNLRAVHNREHAIRLNHNERPFAGSGLEQAEIFARAAASVAENFENRAAATRAGQFVIEQTVAS